MNLTSISSTASERGTQTDGSSDDGTRRVIRSSRAFTSPCTATGIARPTSCDTTSVAAASTSRRFGTSDPATSTPRTSRMGWTARRVARSRSLNVTWRLYQAHPARVDPDERCCVSAPTSAAGRTSWRSSAARASTSGSASASPGSSANRHASRMFNGAARPPTRKSSVDLWRSGGAPQIIGRAVLAIRTGRAHLEDRRARRRRAARESVIPAPRIDVRRLAELVQRPRTAAARLLEEPLRKAALRVRMHDRCGVPLGRVAAEACIHRSPEPHAADEHEGHRHQPDEPPSRGSRLGKEQQPKK